MIIYAYHLLLPQGDSCLRPVSRFLGLRSPSSLHANHFLRLFAELSLEWFQAAALDILPSSPWLLRYRKGH